MDREKFILTLYFAFEWQKSGNFRRKSDFHSYFHFSVLFVFYYGHNSDWLTHLLRQAISARLSTLLSVIDVQRPLDNFVSNFQNRKCKSLPLA